LVTLVLLSQITYSQDTLKVKQIDSIVRLTNNSGYKIQRDTIKQEPASGLSMQTYLSMVSDDDDIKKYVNNVHMTMTQNGIKKNIITTNTFYFDKNKLIKVEEYIIEGEKRSEVEWYYSNDKPIYNTLKSEKGQDRAEFLLKLAKSMLETMKTKNQGDQACIIIFE
jgi:hypothetical protein